MRCLKEPTRYGALYDIDARLRPDGNKGVLAVNHDRIVEYYEQDAQPWERLALMKVRAVAGDADFGRTVEERLRTVAFALPLTPENRAQIADICAKLVKTGSPLNLKKDEGGLIEIEFAVRLLQLRHAARIPDLKRSDVLGALEVLAERQVVSGEDCAVLREGYLLLRRIENRIRMMHGRSASDLPEDPAMQAEFALRLGLDGDIEALVREHKQRVHALYTRIVQKGSGD
jgi:glutamate-ammonia-ligase adenylyltransferase